MKLKTSIIQKNWFWIDIRRNVNIASKKNINKAALRQRYIPQLWKVAEILTILKLGKPPYVSLKKETWFQITSFRCKTNQQNKIKIIIIATLLKKCWKIKEFIFQFIKRGTSVWQGVVWGTTPERIPWNAEILFNIKILKD